MKKPSSTNTPQSKLFSAIKAGDVDAIVILFDQAKKGGKVIHIHEISADGSTPLRLAAESGQGEIVALLLERQEYSPVDWALGLLLQQSQDLSEQGLDRSSVLGLMKERILVTLASCQANVSCEDDDERTDLTNAAYLALLQQEEKPMTCGITQESPKNPVTINGIQWYEHDELERWLVEFRNTTDPQTRVNVLFDQYMDISEIMTYLTDPNANNAHLHPLLKDFFEKVMKKAIDSLSATKDKDIPKDLFFSAIEKGHVSVASALLPYLADINAVGAAGETALYVTASHGHQELVEALITRGANLKAALSVAHERINLAAIDTLGALQNKINQALIRAATENDLGKIKRLLKRGADINAAEEAGNTALYNAASSGHSDVVKFLLSKNADVCIACEDGSTPFFIAVYNSHYDAVESLLSHGIDTETKLFSQTALYIAAKQGNARMTTLLVSGGANIKTAFSTACEDKNAIAITLLEEQKRALGSELIDACRYNNVDTAISLVAQGADINNVITTNFYFVSDDNRDVPKTTALITAAKNNNLKLVDFLVDNGANIPMSLQFLNKREDQKTIGLLKDKQKRIGTTLYAAAMAGDGEKASALVEQGASIQDALATALGDNSEKAIQILEHQKDNISQALIHAAAERNLDKIEYLLEQGADINAAGEAGNTALYNAASSGHSDVVKFLLSKNADARIACEDGSTPLFIAACNNHTQVAELLLINGSDIEATCYSQTALYIAAANNNTEVVDSLVNWRANIETALSFSVANNNAAATHVLESQREKIGNRVLTYLINGMGAQCIAFCMNRIIHISDKMIVSAFENKHGSTLQTLIDEKGSIEAALDAVGLQKIENGVSDYGSVGPYFFIALLNLNKLGLLINIKNIYSIDESYYREESYKGLYFASQIIPRIDTQEYQDLFNQIIEHRDVGFCRAIIKLQEAGILQEKLYKLLASNSGQANNLASAWIILHDTKSLTPEYIDLTVKHAMHATDIAYSIGNLYTNDILTKNRIGLIDGNPRYCLNFSVGLYLLHLAKIETPEYIALLTKAGSSSDTLAKGLATLHSAEIQTPEYIALLTKAGLSSKPLAEGLATLHSAEIQTPEYIALLTKAGLSSKTLAEGLVILHKAEIATPECVACLTHYSMWTDANDRAETLVSLSKGKGLNDHSIEIISNGTKDDIAGLLVLYENITIFEEEGTLLKLITTHPERRYFDKKILVILRIMNENGLLSPQNIRNLYICTKNCYDPHNHRTLSTIDTVMTSLNKSNCFHQSNYYRLMYIIQRGFNKPLPDFDDFLLSNLSEEDRQPKLFRYIKIKRALLTYQEGILGGLDEQELIAQDNAHKPNLFKPKPYYYLQYQVVFLLIEYLDNPTIERLKELNTLLPEMLKRSKPLTDLVLTHLEAELTQSGIVPPRQKSKKIDLWLQTEGKWLNPSSVTTATGKARISSQNCTPSSF